MSLKIRAAIHTDAALIVGLIAELAAYERLSHEAVATVVDIEAALFSAEPKAFCDLAEINGEAVGMALWFYNFSTFVGRHGLYLEDLYVRADARGQGAGKALLTHLARRCVDEKLGRMEWSVLDWNAPAIAFYDVLGSVSMDDWRIRRLTGEALAALANG
ncbi:MAG: GNAT family N-acetyltransferase [Caulobacteraceae bacterium]